jgi:hypothetical protein
MPRRTAGVMVQDLGAEAGQLARFVEADALDALRALDDPRVGREHAVHVGPDLDGVRLQRGPEQRRRVVGAPAAERGRDPLSRRPDEAAGDGDAPLAEQRLEALARRLGDGVRLRLGAPEVVVGDHRAPRVDELRGDAAGPERRDDERRREQLALRGDGVERAGGEEAEHAQRLGEAGELVEGDAQLRPELVGGGRLGHERLDGREVPLAQPLHPADRADEVALRRRAAARASVRARYPRPARSPRRRRRRCRRT